MEFKNIKIVLLFLAILLGTVYLVKYRGASSCQCCSHTVHTDHNDHAHCDHNH